MVQGMGLQGLAMTFVGTGILIGIGLLVLTKVKTAAGVDATADFNTTIDNAIGAGKDISGWFGLLVVALIGGLVIGIFYGKGQGWM